MRNIESGTEARRAAEKEKQTAEKAPIGGCRSRGAAVSGSSSANPLSSRSRITTL